MSAYIRMLICMRTTLNLNDDLVQRAKQRAAAEDRTLTSVIEDALRRLLTDSGARDRREPYTVELMVRSDVQPGLDPNDPAFYKQIFEQDDFEKYGPHTQVATGSSDASL